MHTRLGLAVAALLVAPLAACGGADTPTGASTTGASGSSSMVPITPASSAIKPGGTTSGAGGDGTATQQLELDPLNADGSVKTDFHIASTVVENNPVSCTQASPAAHSGGVYLCTPPSEACVAALSSPQYAGQVLCLMSATEPTLMLHKADKLETVKSPVSPAPLEMETSDGSRWVMANGDSATVKPRPDGLAPAYDCAAGPCEKGLQTASERLAILGQPGAGGAAIDGSKPLWSVQVGDRGATGTAKPTQQSVTKAWYVKNSSAH